jgi:hypothetical protein
MRLFFVLAAALSTTLCATVKIHEKIIFAGICKNTAKGFDNVKASIERLAPYFDDYAIVIYENNSTDETAHLYSKWARSNRHLKFISENLTKEQLDAIAIRKRGGHVIHIARARQKVLDVVLSEKYDDFKYVLMADLDKFDPWDVEEILRTILRPEHPFDAVFANGSYDTFALRSPLFNVGIEHVGHSMWFRNLHFYHGRLLKQQLDKGNWLPVESGFGGLAIYQRDSLKGASYGCQIDAAYYRWMTQRPVNFDHLKGSLKEHCMSLWQTHQAGFEALHAVGFDASALDRESYPTLFLTPCEHVWLHYQMIDNGHGRMYINPKLKMRSQDHPNF